MSGRWRSWRCIWKWWRSKSYFWCGASTRCM